MQQQYFFFFKFLWRFIIKELTLQQSFIYIAIRSMHLYTHYLQRDRLIDYIYLWVWWRQLILHYRDTAPATDPPTPPSWTEWTARYSISGPGRRWTRVSKTRSRDTGDAEKNVMPQLFAQADDKIFV